MAKLRKIETITDIRVYEIELTEEQTQLYKKDEDAFWEKYEDEINDNFDFMYDKAGDPDTEYELIGGYKTIHL